MTHDRLVTCRQTFLDLQLESTTIVAILEDATTAVRSGGLPSLDFERIRRFQETYENWRLAMAEIVREANLGDESESLSLENAGDLFRRIEKAYHVSPVQGFLAGVFDWAEQITFSPSVNPNESDLFRERVRDTRNSFQQSLVDRNGFDRFEDALAILRIHRLHCDRSLLPELVAKISSDFPTLPTIALAFIAGETSYSQSGDVIARRPENLTWDTVESFVKELRDLGGICADGGGKTENERDADPDSPRKSEQEKPSNPIRLPRKPAIDRLMGEMLRRSLPPILSCLPNEVKNDAASISEDGQPPEKTESLPPVEGSHTVEDRFVSKDDGERDPEMSRLSVKDVSVTPRPKIDIPWDFQNVRQAAGELGKTERERERELLQQVVWLLLEEYRIGPAYYLTLYLEEKYAESDFPKELLEAMAICPGIVGITDSLIDRYRMKIDKGTSFLNQTSRPPYFDILVLSALIWPALTASREVVRNQLEKLFFPAEFVEFGKIRDELMQSGNVPFSARMFRHDPDVIDRKQLRKDIHDATEKYLKHQSQATIKFQAATQILHQWVSKRGPIGKTLGLFLDSKQHDNLAAIKEMEAFAADWSRQTFVESQVRQDEPQTTSIDGKALLSLIASGREAARLAAEWVRVLRMSNDHNQNNGILEYRKRILDAMDQCRASVHVNKLSNRCEQAAVACVFHVFDEMKKVFSTKREEFEFGNEQLIDLRLNAELLLIPSLDLDENGKPACLDDEERISETEVERLKTAILNHLSETPVVSNVLLEAEWRTAIDGHLRQKNFNAPNIILDFLRFPGWLPEASAFTGENEPAFKAETFREGVEKRLAEERQKLLERKRDVVARIAFARQKGFLEEEDRQRFNRIAERISPEKTRRIDLADAALTEIDRGLDECRRGSIEITRKELDEWQDRDRYPEEFKQICDIAESGDILRAFDLFNVLKNEKELPSLQPIPLPGLDFYPEFVAKSAAQFSTRQDRFVDFARQFELWRAGGKIGDYTLKTALPPQDSKTAAEILRIWNSQRQQARPIDPVALQKILEYIGFRQITLEKVDLHHFRMKLAKPLGDRNDCILKDFGSDCKDGYDILCLREQKTGEAIIDEVKRLNNLRRPVILLYFRQMGHKRRTELVRLLREQCNNSLRLLVLDDILMVYLCLCRNKLLSFFNAASQFSIAEPFTNTAGIVPVEMFFGREKEVDKIVDMKKSSLVYGGRQLGKTVLLRYVEQREHDPEQGRIVLFINLKDFRDEIERETSAVWSIIAQSLAPFKIVGAKAQTERTVRQGINEWLDESGKQDRTILLLLDEADLFLRRDREDNWRQLDSFNAMMIEKERRFKIVFAGLHNVQRTAVSSNSPIAHLQDPVCIGPFLRREEIADAMRMIKYPFEAMGYRFKNDDMVGSILAQVNYYPSLIQIFCMKLLESIKYRKDLHSAIEKTAVDTPPPYLITEREVERIFGNKDFQHEISERFRFTIRLDNRYFVIALTMALEYLRTQVDHFSLRDIQELSREWWPEGFNEKEHQILVLESLLDEMTDLGVLREVGDNTYFFRNANVIRLLGTEERIETDLLDAITNNDLFKTADPLTFRRRLDRSPWKRMPLIRPEEEEIFNRNRNEVFLLFGTEASGLEDVLPFYDENAVPGLRPFKGTMLTHFTAWLDKAAEIRTKNISVLIVGAKHPWTRDWMFEAKRKLDSLTSTDKMLKILFLCDAAKCWSDFSSPDGGYLPFRMFSLVPWEDSAVRHWLDDFDFIHKAADAELQFRKITGLWHRFLIEAGEACLRDEGFWEAKLEGLASPGQRKNMMDRFELPEETVPMMNAFVELAGKKNELSPVDFRDLLLLDGKEHLVHLVTRFAIWGRKLGFLSTMEPSFGEVPENSILKMNPFLADLIREGGQR